MQWLKQNWLKKELTVKSDILVVFINGLIVMGGVFVLNGIISRMYGLSVLGEFLLLKRTVVAGAAIVLVGANLGLPNYFGPQRFGNRGDSHWIGRAFLVKDSRAAIRRILGHPSSTEKNPAVVAARYLFLQFRWREALERFPGSYREEKKMLT